MKSGLELGLGDKNNRIRVHVIKDLQRPLDFDGRKARSDEDRGAADTRSGVDVVRVVVQENRRVDDSCNLNQDGYSNDDEELETWGSPIRIYRVQTQEENGIDEHWCETVERAHGNDDVRVQRNSWIQQCAELGHDQHALSRGRRGDYYLLVNIRYGTCDTEKQRQNIQGENRLSS